MARNIFMSSVKIRYLECFIISHKSFIYTLKRRGPRTDPCGTSEITRKGNETIIEIRITIACWLGNCETSLHNHQKIVEY
jgi:hypothetical protein